jgi:hypothetical protein
MSKQTKSKDNKVVAPITNVPVVPEKTLEELRSDDMETRANALVDLLGNSLPAIPKSFNYRMADADRVKNAFDFCFALTGGQPRMALWADQNYGEFMKIYARLLPQQNPMISATGPLTIITGVPDSPLDTPVGGGHIIDGVVK